MKGKRIGKIIFYLFSAVCLLLVLWGLIGKLVAEKKGEKFYLFVITGKLSLRIR